jgi:hypothetical protein
LFPNAALPVADMPNYVISVSDLEQRTRLDFFPKINIGYEQSAFSAFFPS